MYQRDGFERLSKLMIYMGGKGSVLCPIRSIVPRTVPACKVHNKCLLNE